MIYYIKKIKWQVKTKSFDLVFLVKAMSNITFKVVNTL